ncbi:Putative transport protein YdiK [Buchnera aphidicola (Eriosoma lanigerum)]|uniref:AI-2E family transporter YdiK n=1 Tax=Buchnera aphidicola TaxID=9 RepID=UPI00346418FB
MYNQRKDTNLIQTIFLVIFIIIMMFTSFLIIYPFFLSFTWSGMIVISTWPILLIIQKNLGGQRFLAVMIMVILLLLFFCLPVIILVNNLIDNSLPFINWLHSGNLKFPKLIWIKDIPVIGDGLFSKYQNLLKNEGSLLIAHIRPYMSYTSIFFLVQAGKLGKLIVHLICIIIFSGLLYWNGEKIEKTIRHFAFRLGSDSGDAVIVFAGKSIRSVALGIIVTSLIQIILSGIGLIVFNIPYFCILIVLVIFFCLIQLGPLPVLIPVIIWLFLNNYTTSGILLLFWSINICILDSILRPFLIKIGADLPTLLSIFGAIGGLLMFGMIGLFLGPVVLVISYRLILSWMNNVPFSEFLLEKNIKKNNKTE